MSKGESGEGAARWFAALAKPDGRLKECGGSAALLLYYLTVTHDFETLVTNQIGYARLMQITGLCRAAVASGLSKLEKAGLISRIGADGRANRYILHYLKPKSQLEAAITSTKKQTAACSTGLKNDRSGLESGTGTSLKTGTLPTVLLPTITHPAAGSLDAAAAGSYSDVEAALARLPEEERLKILEETDRRVNHFHPNQREFARRELLAGKVRGLAL